jgi:hypothetical protein
VPENIDIQYENTLTEEEIDEEFPCGSRGEQPIPIGSPEAVI